MGFPLCYSLQVLLLVELECWGQTLSTPREINNFFINNINSRHLCYVFAIVLGMLRASCTSELCVQSKSILLHLRGSQSFLPCEFLVYRKCHLENQNYSALHHFSKNNITVRRRVIL